MQINHLVTKICVSDHCGLVGVSSSSQWIHQVGKINGQKQFLRIEKWLNAKRHLASKARWKAGCSDKCQGVSRSPKHPLKSKMSSNTQSKPQLMSSKKIPNTPSVTDTSVFREGQGGKSAPGNLATQIMDRPTWWNPSLSPRYGPTLPKCPSPPGICRSIPRQHPHQ